jgi:hypothetical protein
MRWRRVQSPQSHHLCRATILQVSLHATFRSKSHLRRISSILFYTSVLTERQEHLKNRIHLVDEKPEIVARVLQYMYTGCYDADKVPEMKRLGTLAKNKKHANVGDDGGDELSSVVIHGDGKDASDQRPDEKDGHVKTSPTASESEHARGARQLTPLEVHALVYCAAEKFDIASLEEVANRNFSACLSRNADSEYLREAAELVLSNTRPQDAGIRFSLLSWCVENRGVLSEEIQKLLMEHEPFGWQLGFTGLMNQNREVRALESSLRAKTSAFEEADGRIKLLDEAKVGYVRTVSELTENIVVLRKDGKELRTEIDSFITRFNNDVCCSLCATSFRDKKVKLRAVYDWVDDEPCLAGLQYLCPRCSAAR